MTDNEKIRAIVEEISHVIIGKRDCIEKIMCAILAEGHVLVEDIPGVGKTTLALAFASAMGLEQKRMQFTPDVLPSDITGFNMYRKEQETFVYQPGAVMCNLFLADEINRTSPKTQSALLEVMEENAVTVDGVTRAVPKPFIVIATENPVGYTGTQMLPESQLDRFEVCVKLGYPEREQEMEILAAQAESRPLDSVRQIISKNELLGMQRQVKKIIVKDIIYQYIVDLARVTRNHPGIELGISPRGSLAIAALARAAAYIKGRNYVAPEDVTYVFSAAVRHRLILSAEAKMNHESVDAIIEDVLSKVDKPVPERMKFHG